MTHREGAHLIALTPLLLPVRNGREVDGDPFVGVCAATQSIDIGRIFNVAVIRNKIKAIVLCLSFLAVINVIEAQDTPDDLRKLDVFSGSNWEDAMARLDNLALALQNEPATTDLTGR